MPLFNKLACAIVCRPSDVGLNAAKQTKDYLALANVAQALSGGEQRLNRVNAHSIVGSSERDSDDLATVLLAGVQDGLVGIKALVNVGRSLGGLMRLVHGQQDLGHVVVLHRRCAHGNAVPDLREENIGFPENIRGPGIDSGRGLEGDRQTVVPQLELPLDVVPVVEQCSLRDAGPGRLALITEAVTIRHEIDKLAHEPDERVADEIFLHHAITVVEDGLYVSVRNQEAIIVDEKAKLSPKGEVFGVKSCPCLVDD